MNLRNIMLSASIHTQSEEYNSIYVELKDRQI